MNERVFIYTQAYNAQDTLRRAVDSVLAQNFCGVQPEYLLIDNGSTDGTSAIVQEYARRVSWVRPVRLDMNIPNVSLLVAAALRRFSGDGYYMHLDADDEYQPAFFETAYRFLTEERLDIAACGVTLADAAGQVRTARQLPCDTVWTHDGYADGYLRFRRFFMERWGKLYRLPAVRASFHALSAGVHCSAWDYQDTLDIVARTDRIGVLSRQLYMYYSSPAQFTKGFRPEDIQTLPWQIGWLRRWLARFGPVSRLNEDYLAAIYLGWCEGLTDRLLHSPALSAPEKLEQLQRLFTLPETAEVLARAGCDPQFRNLAGRDGFVRRVREEISALGGEPDIIPANRETNR